MKKIGLVILAAMALITGGVINAHQVSADTAQQPSEEKFDTRIFRIYNPNTGEHLLTPSGWEIVVLEKEGWKAEGVAFYASQVKPPYSGYPIVQRLYNPNAKVGSHHFTMSSYERNYLIKAGWKNEGIAFNAYSEPNY